MSRRKPRTLRPDEIELWDKVRRSAVPLQTDRRQILQEAVEKMSPGKTAEPLAPFTIGQKSQATRPEHDFAPKLPSLAKDAAVRMDRKRFGSMQKGKLAPEARIDLHGMTLDQAHRALAQFINDTYQRKLRLVLVITGKGRDLNDVDSFPDRRGVLKRQVPHWLQAPPLKSLILQVSEAHLKHGGSGAYYIYLRRNR